MSDMTADPFADETDEDDPFASADDMKGQGGPFVPWPPIEFIKDRLVVLVPKTFDPEAKVSEYLQKTYNLPPTREEWKTDLIILDGGDLAYPYRAKVEGSDDTFEERTHEVSASDLPYIVTGWKVNWGNIIGALNKIADSPKPFALGRIRAGYSAKEMRAGKTFEGFAEELEAFYANPRGKKEPRPVWHFVGSDEAQDRALARSWWAAAKESGYKV